MNTPTQTETALRDGLAQLANEVLIRHPALICAEVQIRSGAAQFSTTLFVRDAFGESHCGIGSNLAEAECSVMAKVKPAMQLAVEKRAEAERLIQIAERLEATNAA